MEGVPEYLFLHVFIEHTHVNLAISCIPNSATLNVVSTDRIIPGCGLTQQFKQKASDAADSAQGAMAPTGFSCGG
jgi:hypothetical protein